MAGWTKLFSSIVTSSIWCEDDATLRVWIAMLATATAEGVVEGSIPGFANLAKVTPDQMRHALEILRSPDPDSRSKENEGRRIKDIDGGWQVLNYERYRSKPQAKLGSRAEYMRRYRKRNKRDSYDVTCDTEAEADVEGEQKDTIVELAHEVFAYWQERLKHPRSKRTPDRIRKIKARLREGYTVEDCKKAIDGCASSAWHMGENKEGTVYDSVELIFRNGEKLEDFIKRERQRKPGSSSSKIRGQDKFGDL